MKSGFARNEVFQHELRSSYLWFRLCVREASARAHSRRHGATCYWIRESSIGKAPPSGQTKPSISSFNFFDFLIFFSSFTVLSHPYSSFWISWLVSDNSSTFSWNASSRLSCNSCPSLAARCILLLLSCSSDTFVHYSTTSKCYFSYSPFSDTIRPHIACMITLSTSTICKSIGKDDSITKGSEHPALHVEKMSFSTLPVQLRFHQRNSQLHVLIFGMAKTFWI